MFTAPVVSVAPAVSNETPAQRAAAFTATAHRYAQQAQSATFGYQRREWEAKAAKYLRFAANALEAAPVEVQAVAVPVVPVAAPVEVAPAAAPQVQPVRCERVQAMRAAFAAAKKAGLSSNAQAMKIALSKYLSLRPGFSRADLSAGQWCEVAAAIELGILAW